MKYRVYNIMLVFIGIIIIFTIGLFLKNSTSNFREGFTWSKQSVHDFLKFQDTINYNTQFNMEMIQQQASEEVAVGGDTSDEQKGDMLIVFTDGYFFEPSICKRGKGVLFLIYNNPQFTPEFGKAIIVK